MSPNLAEVRDDAGPGMAAEAPARKPSVLERAGTGPSPGARPRVVKTHPWVRGVTQLLRRGHLYAGLLMLPWVFLYGITGLLFNHPTWFSDQVVIVFGRSESKGTPIETLPGAAEVAVEVVRAINARGGEVYRLVSPRDARYERGGLGATVVTRDGRAYSVSVDPDGGGGSAREARGSAAGGRGGPRGGPRPSRRPAGRGTLPARRPASRRGPRAPNVSAREAPGPGPGPVRRRRSRSGRGSGSGRRSSTRCGRASPLSCQTPACPEQRSPR